jgi:hypothetical protein
MLMLVELLRVDRRRFLAPSEASERGNASFLGSMLDAFWSAALDVPEQALFHRFGFR